MATYERAYSIGYRGGALDKARGFKPMLMVTDLTGYADGYLDGWHGRRPRPDRRRGRDRRHMDEPTSLRQRVKCYLSFHDVCYYCAPGFAHCAHCEYMRPDFGEDTLDRVWVDPPTLPGASTFMRWAEALYRRLR